ncbi:MAG: helix-turn-helix domain-containing protein [Sedimentisphaerales bacterium]
MAGGMFYSLKEASEKLGKSEDEVRNLVKSGRLREFRDGSNLLFKVDEVNAMLSDTSSLGMEKPKETPAEAKPQTEGEAEEILLAPDTPAKSSEEIELSDADTQIVEDGIKVLGETDSDTADALREGDATFKGLEEPAAGSPGKESSLEEIEKDVSLDTFGSGSGLLDLSLQADDTSLGGILDEIYTPGQEAKGAAPAASGTAVPPTAAESSALEVAAEADQMISEGQFPEAAVAPAIGARALAFEPEPDAMSNALGVMLFIPLLAVVYTAIVAVAGFSFVTPAILKTVQGFIWYIAIGLAVVSGLIAVVGMMAGGEKKPKAPKAPKPPKVKKEKPPKPEKAKK